jgi:hypothetical protein
MPTASASPLRDCDTHMAGFPVAPPPTTTLRPYGGGVAGTSDTSQTNRRPACRSGKDPPESFPAWADPKYQLSDDDREWVARVVDGLGPPTQRQRDALGRLLRKPP